MGKAVAKREPLPDASTLVRRVREGDANPLTAAIRRAEDGDRDALDIVGQAFELLPTIRAMYGDIAARAEDAIIASAANKNALERQMMGRRLEELRQQLLGPSPTALERLLVERVVLCWFQANHADALDARGLGASLSLKQLEKLEKRADRANARFLAAVKTLALVRRLALPALQVNIAAHGGQQVNVGSVQAREAAGGE